MHHYPTRTPGETANLEAFLAESIARRFPDGAPPPNLAGKVILKVKKLTPRGQARIVERMAADMYRHGEGMTEGDLVHLGYSAEIQKLCAPKAREIAAARANLN
jgi:hypothetical protein